MNKSDTITFLDNKHLKSLKKLDDWLSKQPWDKDMELSVFLQLRELITKIEDKGYYDNEEKDMLNYLREEYFKSKQ